MALGEFELIERFFSRGGTERGDVLLGVGDDAALVRVPPGQELVVAADTLVSGVHFPLDLAPQAIGYRTLAVNLSDMAAMGATPAWFTLALTLPAAEEGWLAAFSTGLLALAREHGVALIGGDTTSGPLTVTVQILGLVPRGRALRRSGARTGDWICVSGELGAAAGGLRLLATGGKAGPEHTPLIERFLHPTPRVALGMALRGIATAAIDVSDGLYADLGKLVQASGVGARLDIEALPVPEALARCFGAATARELALAGGDDYELCFTVPAAQWTAAQSTGVPVRRIGVIEKGAGVRTFESGRPVELALSGYDHFRR